MRALFILPRIMALSACGGSPATRLLKEHHNDVDKRDDFGVCKGYGCRYT